MNNDIFKIEDIASFYFTVIVVFQENCNQKKFELKNFE